jgi:DNA topoisomerase-1
MAAVEKPWTEARLRRSSCAGPGIVRVRRGRGFSYVDEGGERITEPEVLERIAELVIPPAWEDVWICPYPGGHVQATGTDQRGRKQYLYHPKWRQRRDLMKFDDMVVFARTLPTLRERVEEDLARDDLSYEHVLAAATRLLDRGFFRIGSEDYAVTNETYGLATIRKSHVRLHEDQISFDYPAKHGKRRVQSVIDPEVADVIGALKRRRGGGPELLAYKRSGGWADIRSPDINAYLKEATGEDVSAKDFRTWGATVLAAVALAVAAPNVTTATARKKAVRRAVVEVAHYLGNTPAVARGSYIDPRVIDRFDGGVTIGPVLDELGDDGEATAIQGPVEEAVLDLIADDRSSEFVEKVQAGARA